MSQATRLVKLAEELEVLLFHDPDDIALVRYSVDGQAPYVSLVESEEFAAFLSAAYSDRYQEVPGNAGMKDAIRTLKGKAQASENTTPEDLLEAVREVVAAGDAQRTKQADELVRLVLESGAELFHDPDKVGYATVPVDNHRETHPLRTRDFKLWMRGLYYEANESSPAAQAVQDAVEQLDARAIFREEEEKVHVRVAGDDSVIWVDLCDEQWQAVEVTAAGWRVVINPPVKFRRRRGMMPLASPVGGGSIDELWHYLNVEEQDRSLVAGFLVAALRPTGPYAILSLLGEHGSAKTTAGRVIRRLIDPNKADLRDLPHDRRDVMIAASNGWVVGFDNVSKLQDWLSNTLCQLATGAGFGTRELYADDDETIFDAMRPVILTGIADVATRPDLLDRSLIIHLPQVTYRRQEREFWSAFDAAAPRLLGAVLEAVSCAMRRIGQVHLEHLPRMADFAAWATAAEPALGLDDGTFVVA